MQMQFAGLCFTDASGAAFTQNLGLAALSYLAAAAGSYAALEMAEGWRAAGERSGRVWLAGNAVTLGGSIWAMHFVGLLGMRLPVPVTYDPGATLLSLAIATLGVATGLQILHGARPSAMRLVAAGAVVGFAIAAMHYVGMAAVRFPGRLAYHPGLFAASVLIAMLAATAALWCWAMARALWQRIASALAMAAAICAMHYTGMAATVLLVDPTIAVHSGIDPTALAVGVASAVFTLTVAASGSRRLYAAADHEAHALRGANAALEATQREILRRLCRAGEFRDSDTGEHVDRIGQMAHRLALAAGFDAGFAEALLVAAPLHDIGKIGISDSVLLKPGKLEPNEWAEMRRHSDIGHTILVGTGVKLLDLSAEIAQSHHEKWDGSGYPLGLAGEAIPVSGRLVAIVDVFDALLSPRPYKQPWPLAKAVAHIRAQSGRHFDPHLVEAFMADLPGIAAIHLGAPELRVPELGAAELGGAEASRDLDDARLSADSDASRHAAFVSRGVTSP